MREARPCGNLKCPETRNGLNPCGRASVHRHLLLSEQALGRRGTVEGCVGPRCGRGTNSVEVTAPRTLRVDKLCSLLSLISIHKTRESKMPLGAIIGIRPSCSRHVLGLWQMFRVPSHPWLCFAWRNVPASCRTGTCRRSASSQSAGPGLGAAAGYTYHRG